MMINYISRQGYSPKVYTCKNEGGGGEEERKKKTKKPFPITHYYY